MENVLNRFGRPDIALKLTKQRDRFEKLKEDEKKEMDIMARFSKEAYDRDRKQRIGDYFYIPELSSKKRAVYRNLETGQLVVSQRGTDIKDYEDLNNDILLSMGKFKDSKRYKQEEEFLRDLLEKGEKITLTGHSLGGHTAKALARELKVPAVVFSAGEGASWEDFGSNLRERFSKNIKSYKTQLDPVSALNPFARVIEMKEGYKNPHSLDHFIDDSKIREDEIKKLRQTENINPDIINQLFEDLYQKD